MILRRIIAIVSFTLFSSFSFSQEKSAQEFQDNLNKEFSNKSESPLEKKDFKKFTGLDFYPINQLFVVEAQFKKLENEKVFEMKTSTDRHPKYIKYGELSFVINSKSFKLFVYQNQELIKKEGYEDYLFLPFSDLTCGYGSYIGGRYLDLKIPNSDKIIIDFNKSYNPLCAYSHRFSCPLVPLENDLKVEILAGVKKFHD